MSGVVFQELRESRALAYTVWAQYFPASMPQLDCMVSGYIGTQSDKAAEALNAFLDLFDHLPLSQERFDAVMEAIDNQLRTEKVSFRKVLPTILNWQRMGLKQDPRQGHFERLDSFTLADLEAFHQRSIKGKPKLISILGPADRSDLEALKAESTWKELNIETLFVD
jgi:predicted Zn-dependent peptidase